MLIGTYRLFRVIGNGSFSTVKLGYNIFTQAPVAVKIINKSPNINNNDLNWMFLEVEVMRSLDHPAIVKLIDFIEDDFAYYIVMEYCGGGELFDFIIARNRVEEPLAKRLFKQIVLAVSHIHMKNIVHRDLKPENLLLTETNNVKLIDFGLCSNMANEALTNRCGSACYIAPEALTSTSYFGKPADIWALGVILYALVDGSLPWHYEDPEKMYNQIVTGDFAPPKALSEECLNLIRSILNPDPLGRISIEEILVHPWLNGVGNVFHVPKPVQKKPEPRLSLSMGGFSFSNLLQSNQIQQQEPTNTLETIYEDEGPAPRHSPLPKPSLTARKQKPVQPRSISLNTNAMSEAESDDGTNTHRGPILSQTISHRDPNGVALKLENVLLSMGISYRKPSALEFSLVMSDIHINAEVCKLYGFRNVYVISFKRIDGDSWNYAQFVSSILNKLK